MVFAVKTGKININSGGRAGRIRIGGRRRYITLVSIFVMLLILLSTHTSALTPVQTVHTGPEEGPSSIPETRQVCVTAGSLGLGGVRVVGENRMLVAFVYQRLGTIYNSSGKIEVGYIWQPAQLSVEADWVTAIPVMDLRSNFRIPVLPDALEPSTRICVNVPLLPLNVTLEEAKKKVPLSGKLAVFRFRDYVGYLLVGLIDEELGGELPTPTYVINPPPATEPLSVLNVVANPEWAELYYRYEPPTSNIGTVVASFKSRSFDMSEYPKYYAYYWWAYAGLIDFPNGTSRVRFILTNNTSPGYSYSVSIDIYDENENLIYVDSGSGWIYIDGRKEYYIMRELDLVQLGFSGQPVKIRIVLRGTGPRKRTIDGVIYAYVRASDYINNYVSIGAHNVEYTVDEYYYEYNPHLIYNSSYILIPQVQPAPGHIYGTAQFQASITYSYMGDNPPSSLTIYAYYGGVKIGSSTAYREYSSGLWVYRFTSWSWSWMKDRAVRRALMLMGGLSDILVGPFPYLGYSPYGDKIGTFSVQRMELRGAFRPEMNRKLSAIWSNYETVWLYAFISEHRSATALWSSIAGMAQVRVSVRGDAQYPGVAILLNPYKDERTNTVYRLPSGWTFRFKASRSFSSGVLAELYVSDETARHSVEYASAFISIANLIVMAVEHIVAKPIELLLFAGEEALKTATGSISAWASGDQLEVNINVGWAEAGIPQAAYARPALYGRGDYTFSLIEVTVNGKDVPVGSQVFITANSLNKANSNIDKYRTFFCGYQEGDLLNQNGNATGDPLKCNRNAER